MIQKTYRINGIEEISGIAAEIHDMPLYRSASCRVLLTWAQLWDEEDFSAFRQEIAEKFPEFTVVGSNSHSRDDILNDILDGSGDERGCLLTFLFFADSAVSLYGIKTGYREEDREGRELKELILDTKDPKGVFLVPPDYVSSMEDVLAQLKDLKDIPVFGIKTSLHQGYRCFGYEPGKEIMEGRLLALIFHGESLEIRARYNLGWTPVGKIMTVTGEENPFFVDEIDGKAASFVYNRYLGLRNDQIVPQNLSEFPLIIDRDGIRISRIGITGPKEGQLIFGAPVYLNDRIRLSYGNPDDLFMEVTQDTDEIAAFGAQAGLLIVCVNRVMLLREREYEEIELYRKIIKEAAAVYGFGELFYLDGKGGELNSALVSVSMKEKDTAVSFRKTDETEQAGQTEDTDMSDPILVPFHDRLSRMFKEMSGDLIMAVKEAEDANRAKSVFYSAVSHEIRTPLNSILGMNEMILKECGDENILKYAGNIKSAGKLLLQIINDILDTGKIEAGKMEIVPVAYNAKEMMDELAEMISYSAKEKGLEFLYVLNGELPAVLYGDEKRIRQCILNLLSNAVKYTPSGKVIFAVRSSVIDKDHARLNIRVSDSGIGIKTEDIEKLIHPFERVDHSVNYKVEGTGLGLNIVNRLLALMDSKLEIRSVYGQGSQFAFVIDQEIPQDAGADGKEGNTPASAEKEWGDLKVENASILVVDDTEMNLQLVRVMLKNSRIEIDTAMNGPAAIELASEQKYDIIFLDLRMPGMNGIEVFQKLKEDRDALNAATPVILLTANEGEADGRKYIEEGFSDYMSKPFTPVMLEEMIRKHLPEGKLI
ncbi:MAG: response regulator [Lachnospiraceae bacterium]|nr:response regulator [Lachnospiraceae bacterium]